MGDERLSIGQVAERTGLSVHTLRMYERDGLLAGEVRRDGSGRRVYTAWDVEWLANCVKFRASGMPLATIAHLARLVRAGSGNEAERLELLRAHRHEVVARLDQLRDCLALVDAKVKTYEAHLAAGGGDPWVSVDRLASSRRAVVDGGSS
ncbi:MerR family transcriptional regulator [Dactylosporangium sucinum]|uniref:MerR family transcriptional regulator n=1 Tax=Dactylosporangium sucinum TaxID=1424081 RepID=A0A917U3R1_9ACTN|nr:MerR family transcriptional regulator [Dactylosporangium sucinum]GGM55656.1 MerR family transcriptional regulator [Dactylosporangium sucinum]